MNSQKEPQQQLDLIEFLESEGIAPLRLGTPKSDIPVDKPTDIDYDGTHDQSSQENSRG